MNTASAATVMPTVKDMRPPNMARANTSRPNLSEPNQYSSEGGLRRPVTTFNSAGSLAAIQGANIATKMMTATISKPSDRFGLRRTNSTIRRCMGSAAASADSNSISLTAAVDMALVPHPGIEDRIAQVNHQIDEHVDAREYEDDALDDRIVAIEHSLDGEIAHPGDIEDGFDDHHPVDQ